MTGKKDPNILITGTPGVGKSSLCKKIASETGLNWRDVSKIAKDQDCCTNYDEEYSSFVLDDEKLLDYMEPLMSAGGNIVDYHSCDFFPERWFDAVFVLRTDNTQLYDRLVARGYSGTKLDNNIQCEIFQTVLEEAQSSYEADIVFELQNNTESDQDTNLRRIIKWMRKWKKNNKEEDT